MTKSTSEKILEVAKECFAKFGFEGTSIREIASRARCNVAAINYHYKNKDTLYWETYLQARELLETGIAEMIKKSPTLENLSVEIFDFLLDHADAVRNTFKMLISDSTPKPPNDPKYLACANRVGPPGGESVLEILNKELNQTVSLEMRKWAVREIYTYAFHWAILSGSRYMLAMREQNADLSLENIREGLRHHVRAVKLYLLKTVP